MDRSGLDEVGFGFPDHTFEIPDEPGAVPPTDFSLPSGPADIGDALRQRPVFVGPAGVLEAEVEDLVPGHDHFL